MEDGAFTVTSTIGLESSSSNNGSNGDAKGEPSKFTAFAPSPRFGSSLAIKQGMLYLFGGSIEDGDVTYTLKDMYCIGKRHFPEFFLTCLPFGSCSKVEFNRI